MITNHSEEQEYTRTNKNVQTSHTARKNELCVNDSKNSQVLLDNGFHLPKKKSNVGKYTKHGSYGLDRSAHNSPLALFNIGGLNIPFFDGITWRIIPLSK